SHQSGVFVGPERKVGCAPGEGRREADCPGWHLQLPQSYLIPRYQIEHSLPVGWHVMAWDPVEGRALHQDWVRNGVRVDAQHAMSLSVPGIRTGIASGSARGIRSRRCPMSPSKSRWLMPLNRASPVSSSDTPTSTRPPSVLLNAATA